MAQAGTALPLVAATPSGAVVATPRPPTSRRRNPLRATSKRSTLASRSLQRRHLAPARRYGDAAGCPLLSLEAASPTREAADDSAAASRHVTRDVGGHLVAALWRRDWETSRARATSHNNSITVQM